MMKPLQDTLKETRVAIAQRIVASSLGCAIGRPGLGGGQTREDIAMIANQAINAPPATEYTFLRVDFCLAGTECTLSVDAKRSYESRVLDQEGNEWQQAELVFELNYPLHSSLRKTPARVFAWTKFYSDVAQLAMQLEAEFNCNMLWTMTRSAEKLAEDNRIRDERKSNDAVELVLADSVLKGMRAGSEPRLVVNDCVSRITEGRHERIIKDRRFFFVVDHSAIIAGSVDVFRAE